MAKKDLSKAPSSNLLKKITKSGNANANSKTTMDIEVSLIDDNPDNAKIFNMNEIDRLAASIKNEGFAGAIEVYLKDNGRYEISSGHRRVLAVKKLGIKTIPAIVSSMPDNEVIRRTALLSSNINNRDMTPMDYARAINYHEQTLRLKYNTGDSNRSKKNSGIDINKELGEYFGLNVHSIRRYKALVKLLPELQTLIEERKIPYTALEGAVNLDMDEQKQLYKEIQKEINALSKLDRSSDDSENFLPAYTVKRLIDNIKNDEPDNRHDVIKTPQFSEPEQVSAGEIVGDIPEAESHDAISENIVSDASFFSDYNYDAPAQETKKERYDSHFDNFFALIDSFMTLDISSIDKKRRAELKKKLEKIIAML